MSREVLRDAVIYLPAKVVPALVGVSAIPILTRMLSPDRYGQYVLAMTSLILISSFCISWLVSVTIRFYVVFGFQSLVKACRPLLIVSISLACFFWIGVIYFFDNIFESKELMWIGVTWIIAQGFFEYHVGWLRARNNAKTYSLALSWRSIVGLTLAVVLLSVGFKGGGIVILAAAISMFIALGLLYRFTVNNIHKKQNKSTYSRTILREVLRYGLPAAFINVTTVGLSLVDRYFIGFQLDMESVAIYGASYDLAEKTIFFANSLLLLSSSVIGFRIFEQDGELKAVNFLSRLMRLYIIVVSPLIVGLAILSPHLIAIILPEKYAAGANVLPIVALAGMFVGILHRYTLLLSFHKRTDIIMWCSAGALVVNLFACFLLVPKFGLIGAACSTLLAYVSWLLLIRFFVNQYHVLKFPWITFFRVCGSLLAAAGGIYIFIYAKSSVSLILIIVSFMSGLIFYGCSLFLVGEVSKKEVKLLLNIFSDKFRKVK